LVQFGASTKQRSRHSRSTKRS